MAIEAKVDLKSTVCIVSSNRGAHWNRISTNSISLSAIKAKVGEKEAGSRFIPSPTRARRCSKWQRPTNSQDFFRRSEHRRRYSALSNFGMVPAAVMGLDVAKFLNNTQEMVQACGATSAADVNPGVILERFSASPRITAGQNHDRHLAGISDLGAWLEQLIAESPAKIGKGIIPVDRERLAKPAAYGNDRVFAYLRLLRSPTRPGCRSRLLSRSRAPRGAESRSRIFTILPGNSFRWEIATAVAGSISALCFQPARR